MESDGPNASDRHSSNDGTYRRVELITGRTRHRVWTDAEKAEIVAQAMLPGASVTSVARRYQVSRGLLWTWRRKAKEQLSLEPVPDFIPLRLALEPTVDEAPMTRAPGKPGLPAEVEAGGLIEIEQGATRVRVQGKVDPATLRQVLGLIGKIR